LARNARGASTKRRIFAVYGVGGENCHSVLGQGGIKISRGSRKALYGSWASAESNTKRYAEKLGRGQQFAGGRGNNKGRY